MRTITLELLRHGPAHNQLLSPLTRYLALCANHEAVTLQIDIEHNQFLHRLRALSYRLGDETRQVQMQETAKLLAGLLAEVPGLLAEMPGPLPGTGPVEPVHLKLVLTASELALLPFELALAPPAWPGAGQPMLLQQLVPVCITRESQRLPQASVTWPKTTRVLMVVASPPGLPEVPALAHLVALRGRLDAWTGGGKLNDHLTVITDASLQAVQQACAKTAFTHVHILAHGGERRDADGLRYGLYLHAAGDALGPPDVVSGQRLGSALRTLGRDGNARGPTVVTLASCNSGAVGDVASVGGSIAHDLHRSGIPMVIASQFPLSFGGSVRMVDTLYQGLLWGEDPRALLGILRQQLHAQFPDTNDWASITAYTSLPPDFEQQLAGVQIQRAMDSINVALDTAFAAVTDTSADGVIPTALRHVDAAKAHLCELLDRHPAHWARVTGLLASTEKREAELSHARCRISPDAAAGELHSQAMWQALARARQRYFTCYQQARTPYFTIQYLSLTALHLRAGKLQDTGLPGPTLDKLWDVADTLAGQDLRSADLMQRVWALGNLIELRLLAPAIGAVAARGEPWVQQAADLARQMLEATSQGDRYEVFSTRRQVNRFLGWYSRLCQPDRPWPALTLDAARQVVALLPAQPMTDWDYASH